MAQIDPATSLGSLVAEQPARAELFERLRLDFCCGGAQTLAEACAERALDPATVADLIAALDDDGGAAERPDHPAEHVDWQRASVDELCAHIVAVHHEGLRRELPRIGELLTTVVRVHGPGHSEVRQLERPFAHMRAELEQHIDQEERVVFPACRDLEADGAAATLDDEVLALLEDEHAEAGAALATLRKSAHDYDQRQALCGTHRALLEGLQALELDLHQHIHEENNILFPRVRALSGAPGGPAAEPVSDLPLCCQAWAAEQTRPWTHGGGATAA